MAGGKTKFAQINRG